MNNFRQIKTKRGVLTAPVFMPIATRGAVKSLTPEELKNLGAKLILGNAYHLWLKPGMEKIKKAGSLHNFMNWHGPILTDSGGFQIFSLGAKTEKKSGNGGVKITDSYAEFRDPRDGKKHQLTPEKSIEIQLTLHSDIIMVLDECPPYPTTKEQMAKAVARTTAWALKGKKYFDKYVGHQTTKTNTKKTDDKKIINRPLLFGIIQGGIYKDLRIRSTKEILAIGFDGYAIGGVAVGEPRKYLRQTLQQVLPLLPPDKPRYLMGLGRPEEIVMAVKSGIDMFDCVIPTREARHGRLYVFSSDKISDKVGFYKTIQIANAKFAKDFKPLDKNCACYTCQNYSRAYLNHIFQTKEPLALRLATIHNLKFYLQLINLLRRNG